ncbi:exoribonuclease 2 [Hysterangium stoloniferum]|nr:exoribonuclease 2 [Hysterangium stoloniferum]
MVGVPALFRWLSKKYPKIVLPVVEEEEIKIPNEDGTEVALPIDISHKNPNGVEFDNLYLDMNGIVHPCTHPEGKPAPETEEDMMVEIFTYTERVVNMVRPRKLLFMAIDGVAPRAKMNQQRSRRFRSAQEAQEKEEARKESVAMFEAMGHTVSDETKHKKAWDSNAITPGTPFMDLLAAALRYWVTQKINTDPGWKNIQVIISDASVPGEGEHKIMDFIRRQRTNPHHNPNTQHVIYGLDADLIMLSLATHEPHFRVLREDVFFQEGSKTACRICGQEGHYAAQCTGEPKAKQEDVKKELVKKPFIFLDVSILREYLEVELNMQNAPFPFNLERAIDDWVLLIFFVGNDFLPHLPSLEIREGAIDTLLKIWKDELPRMGGYLTNHGTVELPKAEIILEGLARREDDIFRRRREAEERQDQNAKRRKIEANGGSVSAASGGGPPLSREVEGGMRMGETVYVPVEVSGGPPIHPSLPQRPAFALATPVNPPPLSVSAPQESIRLATNHDVVANRRAIRMANLNAAEMLKAELAGRAFVGTVAPSVEGNIIVPSVAPTESDVPVEPPQLPLPSSGPNTAYSDYAQMDVLPGLGGPQPNDSATPSGHSSSVDGPSVLSPPVNATEPELDAPAPPDLPPTDPIDDQPADMSGEGSESMDTEVSVNGAENGQPSEPPHGVKRKLEDMDADADAEGEESFVDEEDGVDVGDSLPTARKVNPDGTVEQEDTVRLWEPGYKERYYRQKFGVELSDREFRKKITTAYVEGLSWVLHYYYQGTPSWTWYYPYHFAPFASDFEDVQKMNIKFETGKPFKAFEQLMGVFPAASRQHIPATFHSLMVNDDSPIIDFYPSTFEIDMNGKKMAWQGVALLPFIDEKRLLAAMAPRNVLLTDEERRRNKWGSNVIFVSGEHPLHPFLSGLYVKRKSNDPIILDCLLSKGIAGSVLHDPQCIPDSTYFSPFEQVSLPDIPDNRSLSALYYYPRQLRPHQSQLLPGVKRPMRVLTSADYETLRRGGRGRGGGGGGTSRGAPYGGNSYGGGSGGYDRGGHGYGYESYGATATYSHGSSGRGGYGQTYTSTYGQSYGGGGGGGGRDYGSHGSNGGYGSYGYGTPRGRGRGR